VLREEPPGIDDVLAGVGGFGFDENGVVGHAVGEGVFAVMDCFASGEAVDGGGSVGAGEHKEGVHASVVEVGGDLGHAEVMAAQADTDIGGA
jgi:hypothetical protein